ncbi:MAG: alpha/beta hydrolase [Bifidobacteriaceae bacterium]|nr:alpha/beta hydrolase [Bifidobacteriaceae bacterium]
MKKWQKGVLIAVGIILVLVIGSLGYLRTQTYGPSQEAAKVSQTAKETDYGLLFDAEKIDTNKADTDETAATKTAADGPTVVFYPGALVEPESYSIWAQKVATAGYPVAIVRFPLNLAVLEGNAAEKVDVGDQGYVIGGHSLGGVMASRYAAAHQTNQLKGVYFMASYPDEKGALNKTSLPVLSLTGSRDGVLKWDAWRSAKQYLPASTVYEQLEGGNHAGFGSYGNQKGDNTATVSDARQQDWIAQQMIQWLAKLK